MGLWDRLFGKGKNQKPSPPELFDLSSPIETDDILIIEPGSERIYNRDFRFPNDPPHIIRLNQDSPGGRTYARNVEVAGIFHEPARTNAGALIRGNDRRLKLERDPTNPYDRNAIKVIGFWRDNNGIEQSGQIGWVPKETARNIAKKRPDAPLDAVIWSMFKPGEGRSAGMRIDIHYHNPWPPREKRPPARKAKSKKEEENQ